MLTTAYDPAFSSGFDARSYSWQTNATVAQEVDANDGKSLSVKYKDGEKKVVVSPDTPIVNFVDGAKSELKAGAKIITLRVAR